MLVEGGLNRIPIVSGFGSSREKNNPCDKCVHSIKGLIDEVTICTRNRGNDDILWEWMNGYFDKIQATQQEEENLIQAFFLLQDRIKELGKDKEAKDINLQVLNRGNIDGVSINLAKMETDYIRYFKKYIKAVHKDNRVKQLLKHEKHIIGTESLCKMFLPITSTISKNKKMD